MLRQCCVQTQRRLLYHCMLVRPWSLKDGTKHATAFCVPTQLPLLFSQSTLSVWSCVVLALLRALGSSDRQCATASLASYTVLRHSTEPGSGMAIIGEVYLCKVSWTMDTLRYCKRSVKYQAVPVAAPQSSPHSQPGVRPLTLRDGDSLPH